MPTKKSEKTTAPNTATPAKESSRKKFLRFLRDERTLFVFGLILLFFAIYLTVSFISFFFNGAADQSVIDYQAHQTLGSINNGIQNWAGSQGAVYANFFINKWMGIPAFLIPLFLARLGLRLMRVLTMSISRSLAYTCGMIILFSLFFGFFFKHIYEGSYLFLGGYHGYYATLWLEARIGWPGTLLIILSGILLLLITASRRTIAVLRHLFRMDFIHWKKKTPKPLPEEESETKTDEQAESTAGQDQEAESEHPEGERGYTPMSDTPVTTPLDQPAEPTQEGQSTEDFPLSPEQEEEKQDPEFTINTGVEEDAAKSENELDEYDPTLDLSQYKAPTFDLLKQDVPNNNSVDIEEQEANKQLIINTLENYGIRISSIQATVGPTVTLYEIIPEAGVRIAKIKNLEDDIALSLSALGIRIIAPIPGKGTVGIEVPNKNPQNVSMHSVIASRKFQECTYDLPLALGKTITNEIYMVDLCKMPTIVFPDPTAKGNTVVIKASKPSIFT
ncbi:MAG: DNA translocase FtsK 4TM domain-containing protein, partial [Porphyromonadaceae bacterium]|nr:DNA translocase FtsK 4TM domain-containing protein [Porphyromonadaceae bacterium]